LDQQRRRHRDGSPDLSPGRERGAPDLSPLVEPSSTTRRAERCSTNGSSRASPS
jgi:hypothetical protein